jgi:hypothetical protein
MQTVFLEDYFQLIFLLPLLKNVLIIFGQPLRPKTVENSKRDKLGSVSRKVNILLQNVSWF